MKQRVAKTPQVWGTFERVRARLFDQHVAPPFDNATGLTREQLANEALAWLQDHADQPRAGIAAVVPVDSNGRGMLDQ